MLTLPLLHSTIETNTHVLFDTYMTKRIPNVSSNTRWCSQCIVEVPFKTCITAKMSPNVSSNTHSLIWPMYSQCEDFNIIAKMYSYNMCIHTKKKPVDQYLWLYNTWHEDIGETLPSRTIKGSDSNHLWDHRLACNTIKGSDSNHLWDHRLACNTL